MRNGSRRKINPFPKKLKKFCLKKWFDFVYKKKVRTFAARTRDKRQESIIKTYIRI